MALDFNCLNKFCFKGDNFKKLKFTKTIKKFWLEIRNFKDILRLKIVKFSKCPKQSQTWDIKS